MSYQASFSLRNFVLLTGSTYGGVAVKFSTIIQQRVKLMCLDLLWPRWAGFYLLTLMILWFGFVKYLSRICSKQIRYMYQLQATSNRILLLKSWFQQSWLMSSRVLSDDIKFLIWNRLLKSRSSKQMLMWPVRIQPCVFRESCLFWFWLLNLVTWRDGFGGF